MQLAATTIEDFSRNPVGKYVAGPTFAHYCVTPTFWGVTLWGRPNQKDAVQLGRTLIAEIAPSAEPHVSLVDASRLVGGDVGAFVAFERYMSRHAEALAKYVLRLALVRPSGLEGAIVAGAYDVIERPYEVSVFGDVEGALAWLDARDGLAIAKAIADMHASATSTPALLGTLRTWLDKHLAEPSIADAASTLAVSERSLQRKLQENGTTFQEEIAEARVRAAKRLLVDGDASLTTIALEVGCASPQHFSALFRRLTGESPSAWRTRSRKV